MAEAAEEAGATVVSQVRYKFGQDSPPGCTAIVMLDESHCSCHTYADLGLIAMDVFTCGSTDPRRIWDNIRNRLGFTCFQADLVDRFISPGSHAPVFAGETLKNNA